VDKAITYDSSSVLNTCHGNVKCAYVRACACVSVPACVCVLPSS